MKRALALAVLLASCADEIPPCDRPACCATPSMIALYPGPFPNEPYGPQPAAGACGSSEHDVILVLGCPTESDGSPSACQIARADIAVALMQAGHGHRFITTGAAVHTPFVEAEALKALLVERGVPEASILVEPKAEHTDENIYYSTSIMEEHGYASAVVVSDDPGHLILTGVCDANCCVGRGRLTVFEFPLETGSVVAGHYVRYPWAEPVTAEECAHIEQGSKFMCTNLVSRRACAGNLQL